MVHQTELASCDTQPAKAQFVISIEEESEGSAVEAPKLLIAPEQEECTPAEFENMGNSTGEVKAASSHRIALIAKNHRCCVSVNKI